MRRWLLAAVGGLGAAVGAAGPPDPAALVARLGADNYADREAAGRALVAAGPAAIAALEAGVRGPNPEVARRAAGVLAVVRRQADSDRLTAAGVVRLSYRGTALAAAVADLRARTGIPLALDPDGVVDPHRPVTCETAEVPVWEAVAAFARAAGLREVFAAELAVPKPAAKSSRGYYAPLAPPPAADAVPVVLADGPYQHLPGSRSAAVRVLALPATFPRNRSVLSTGEVTLHFDVTPAPGSNWQDAAVVRVTRVVDEFGRLGAGGGEREPDGGVAPLLGAAFVARGVALRWDTDGNPVPPAAWPNPRVVPVPLTVATRHARSLRRLEGAVVGEVVVPGAVLAAIDHPAGAVGIPVAGEAGVRVTVLECRADGIDRAATVRVQVEAPSPWREARRRNPWGPLWPEPTTRAAGAGSQFRALDAAGHAVPAGTAAVGHVNDDGVTLTTVTHLTFPDGVPARLVLTGPKPTPVEIPFVMENVPLP